VSSFSIQTGLADSFYTPAKISLLGPLSIPFYNPDKTINLSIGLLHSQNPSVDGFSFNILGGMINGKFSGIQVSGIYSYTKGNMNGFIASGLFNISTSNTNGFTFASLVNMNVKNFAGLQTGGLLAFNLGNFSGTQAAGIYNVVSGNMKGSQVSLISNISSRKFYGVQLSLVTNINSCYFSGLQAGIFNLADTLKGLQTGILNLAVEELNGTQVGLVNYKKGKKGRSIGLINIGEDTKIQLLLSASNCTKANIGVRFRNKYYYSILGIGSPYLTSKERFSGGIFYRLGLSTPRFFKRMELHGDIGYMHINLFDDDKWINEPEALFSLQARFSIEGEILSWLKIFVAGGYSVSRQYTDTGKFDKDTTGEIGIILF
jgi:hypothetical protein